MGHNIQGHERTLTALNLSFSGAEAADPAAKLTFGISRQPLTVL